MRRLGAGLLLLLLVAACGWSNALYNARRLSASAERAEREERSFDAGSLWGQVAVKAESAYARNPDGDRAAEALWLRGRALAHLGDCPTAQPVLEKARVTGGEVDWSDDLRLELARCRSLGGDPEGAVALLEPLLTTDDARLRAQVMQVAGRALVRAGRWAEALAMLGDDDGAEVTWDRALALAHLGRADAAIAEVEPRIMLADSSANWDELVRVVATESPAAIDGLLARLGGMRNATDTTRGRWLLAAAEGLIARGDPAADRYLDTLIARPKVPAASQARTLVIYRRLAAIHDSASLQSVLAGLGSITRGDAAASFSAGQLARWGHAIAGDLEAYPSGTPEGDLAMLFDATVARDTLAATRLAGWLLARLERGWPDSPYLPKALLIRIALEPDSADALRERLGQHPDSPYLAYLRGREGERFAVLEDSLAFYLGDRMAAVIAGSSADAN